MNSTEAISKNTVPAENQISPDKYVKFENICQNGKRILFVGNSITHHGAKEDIGWNNNWGMAASAKENDYVHVLENKFLSINKDTSFCIVQSYMWEIGYQKEETLDLYKSAASYNADVIIMRLGENVCRDNFNVDEFAKHYKELIDYLNPTDKAQVILTTCFWNNPDIDKAIQMVAKSYSYPIVVLGDLGEDDEMKAIGKFEHSGVAQHPGDMGMKNIADRIWNKAYES